MIYGTIEGYRKHTVPGYSSDATHGPACSDIYSTGHHLRLLQLQYYYCESCHNSCGVLKDRIENAQNSVTR